jgi:DNA polymerase I
MTCDWRDLPFREIWCVDFEYYHGPGSANGGADGDPITPLCCVAYEMRSGILRALWQDELGAGPPYGLGPDALFLSYMSTAEFGAHIALGWPKPAFAIDLYLEFRLHTNDARIRSGDRERGFYSLAGALRHFGIDEIDTARKKEMRDRILQGPPFTMQERAEIPLYCRDDALALAKLVPHMVPTIRSLSHAYLRTEFCWATAQQEARGVPLDLPLTNRVRKHWNDIQTALVAAVDKWGIYEIEDGEPHWRNDRFETFVTRARLHWPRLASGALDQSIRTLEDMCQLYPWLNPLREVRSSMGKLRLNSLQIGRDGRNRTLLSPYGSKTGRNQPSTSRYIFGPAKWTRSLISPPPGVALVHRDYRQQEINIAGVVSKDPELLAACLSGDVYLGVAIRLGFAPEGATERSHGTIRDMFKPVILGILYGLSTVSLAARIGVSCYEAGEILARLRVRFRRFEEFTARVIDHAGLDLELATPLGWHMRCPPGTKAGTLRNFPMQSTGAEILHVACILAERRGIKIVAPVHDAIMAEGPVEDIQDVSVALDRVMRDASAIVLQGRELSTDETIVRPAEHYCDKRGAAMWQTVTELVAQAERDNGRI